MSATNTTQRTERDCGESEVRSRRTKMSKHGKSIISGRSCADGVDGVVENGALLSRVE